ncbi:MAG TPA: hypothetical protein VF316_23465, partial [Polyangiaceae bacterium]
MKQLDNRDFTGVPQPWSVGEAIGVGFRSFLRHAPALFGAYFVYLLVSGPFTRLIPWLAARYLPLHVPVVPTAAGVTAGLTLLIGTYLWGGWLKTWIAAARGEPVRFADAFLGGRYFLRLLALQLLFIPLFVLSIPFLGIPFWGIVLAPHFVVDEDRGVFSAIGASWRATRGHKGMLFVFGLCMVPVLILGVAVLGVGYAAAVPVTQISMAFIFVRLSGRGQIGPFPPAFAARSMRILLRTTLAVLGAAFAGLFYAVYVLPTVHGSAFTLKDAAIRASAVVVGVATTIVLLATLLPWILDRLEGRTFSLFVGARHVRSQK